MSAESSDTCGGSFGLRLGRTMIGSSRRPNKIQCLRESPNVQSHQHDDLQKTCASETIDIIRVPASLVEIVLGPRGSTLVQCCRNSGARIALRPVLADGIDDFEAEVRGSPDALSTAHQLLHEIMDGGDHVVEPFSATSRPRSNDDNEQLASDVEEEIGVPCRYVAFVLGGRRCGDKGVGKKKGITEIEQSTGARIVVTVDDEDDHKQCDLRLQIGGKLNTVARVKHDLSKRIKAREDLFEVHIPCPVEKVPLFCGKGSSATKEIERNSGAVVNVLMGKLYYFEAEDGERTCKIEVVGTEDQVEVATRLVQERLEMLRGSGRGKGKSKIHPSNANRDEPSWKLKLPQRRHQ